MTQVICWLSHLDGMNCNYLAPYSPSHQCHESIGTPYESDVRIGNNETTFTAAGASTSIDQKFILMKEKKIESHLKKKNIDENSYHQQTNPGGYVNHLHRLTKHEVLRGSSYTKFPHHS